MLKVALHNLGCKVNSYELDVIQQELQKKGYTIVPFDDMADVYIINTCTVTNIADRKSRQMLHQAKKRNQASIVVAVGCYVQTGMEQVITDAGIDLAIGNNKKKEIVPILETYLQQRKSNEVVDKTLGHTSVLDMDETFEYEQMQLEHTAQHTRAYIKIQDGCNQFCAYCIIPFARGRVRSRHLEDIKAEITNLAQAGYKEVVLTGIHISSYGIDFEDDAWERGLCVDKPQEKTRHDYSGRTKLMELVSRIHDIEGIERIRLGSLEPRIVTTESANLLKSLTKVCPHFHLSLQSGCDTTLERMRRRYTTEEFRRSVEALRKAYVNPAITTDVIVGFPGETQEEFEQTRLYLEDIKLYEMHIFKYSIRQGTAAAKMKGQLTDSIKTERSSILQTINCAHGQAFRSLFLNEKVLVLFEEEKVMDGKIYQIGHTREYIKVAVETDEQLINQIKSVSFTGEFLGEMMIAEK
ncbi:MAG: MiaB/RimO family radical SAM methylthiotransferase [Lachnospiraceae bacterium]